MVLEVSHLSVRFGRNSVLTDLSFSVAQGTALAILGPNGAGKTVLFKALIGAIPFDGQIRWEPGTRIGYVPQKLDLDRGVPITGRDFLGARAALAGESGAAVSRALAEVGVPPEVADRPIGIISAGQFQRLLLAFALVGNPNVLLLDEPTAGVDEAGQEQLNELLLRLQRQMGLTTLFISHEVAAIYRYATHVLCLSRERAWTGPPRSILTPELLREMYGSAVSYHVHDS